MLLKWLQKADIEIHVSNPVESLVSGLSLPVSVLEILSVISSFFLYCTGVYIFWHAQNNTWKVDCHQCYLTLFVSAIALCLPLSLYPLSLSLSLCWCVSLCVCVSECLCVFLSVCLCLCLHVCVLMCLYLALGCDISALFL